MKNIVIALLLMIFCSGTVFAGNRGRLPKPRNQAQAQALVYLSTQRALAMRGHR